MFSPTRPKLEVPLTLLREHPSYVGGGGAGEDDAEEIGRRIFGHIASRMGIDDFSNISMLDFGCGARGALSIINTPLAIQKYTGVDIDKELISFLKENAVRSNVNFAHADFVNTLYSGTDSAEIITTSSKLPIPDEEYDLACMLNVLIHQYPDHAAALLSIMHRYVGKGGYLFFTVLMNREGENFDNIDISQPYLMASYTREVMEELLRLAGWETVSIERPSDLLQTSYLCRRN